MSTIAPLPADLGTLTAEDIKEAIRVRRERGNEMKALVGDPSVSRREVHEMQQLTGDLARLKEHSEQVEPHPGFPTPPGQRRSSEKAARYGRFEGIGDAFVLKLQAALDGTSGGTLVDPFYVPNIEQLPQRALLVRSLIPTAVTTGDKVWYLRQTVATHAAAAVAAGGLKPTSTYTVERVETPVTTVAHVTEALDRSLLSDHEGLRSFLDNQLRLGVLYEEEDQILNGSGSAPNLRGILNTSGIQTQAKGADTVPDAIYKAITKVRNVFLEPDGIVIHPNDWQEIRLLKDADGMYVVADAKDEAPERLFGIRVVVSPVLTEGTAIVGAFGAVAQVWDREQARVSFAEQGLNDSGNEMYTRNQVRFRGESRIAFGVLRPNGFCTVTGI